MRTPSGEQLAIAFADQSAVITEVGASLRAYLAGGVAVVDGYHEEAMAGSGRGQVLAPWPNRLEDGTYRFEGVAGRAALDEPDRRNAIHGLVRWARWEVTRRAEHEVVLGCELPPQPAYPFWLRLEVGYRLDGDGLTVTSAAECTGDVALPFGIGFHPYLTVGTDRVDEALLTLPADHRLELDDRSLPRGEVEVAGTAYDFRTERAIGDLQLDDCYRTPGGGEVVLRNPSGPRSIVLWTGAEFGYLMCFTADTVGDAARRRRSVALEPMTCPPNAFRSGTDLVRLAPGERWRGSWGIRPGGAG